MNLEQIHVLIVEDHAIVRRGLKEIIADMYPRALFGEASDTVTALGEFQTRKWDIVLLDINIPGRGGLDAITDMRHLDPQARILIVSAYSEEEFAVRAFKLGAAGYLSKGQASDELVNAVETVLAGRKYVTASLAQRIALALSNQDERALHDALSPRELQVLRLVAGGKTLKQIAAELALSDKTIETYRARIAEKTGLSSNVELTRYAFQNGLTR